MRVRKGGYIFCSGFGAGKVTEYTPKEIIALDFPHLEMNTKLMLSSPNVLDRLRNLGSAQDIINTLNILNTDADTLPSSWSVRKDVLNKKLKTTLLTDIAEIIRDLNALPQYNIIPNYSDLAILSKARDIMASEIFCVMDVSWDKACTLVENTPALLEVEVPRRRGRKPKDWKPEDEERTGKRPGLLSIDL